MAQGQKRFTTSNRNVTKFDRTPLPSGDYDLKILGREAEVRKAQGPGKLPYVAVGFEALDTAKEEGQKNRRVHQNFWINTTPNASGGAPVDNAGQILGLADAIGERESLDAFRIISMQYRTKKGEMTQVDCINPHDLKKWFVDHDGIVVKAHTLVRKSKDFPPKAEIDAFIPGEEAGDAMQEQAADEGEYDASEVDGDVAEEGDQGGDEVPEMSAGEEYAEETVGDEADTSEEMEAEEEQPDEEPAPRRPAPRPAATRNGTTAKQVQRAAAVAQKTQAQRKPTTRARR